MSTNWKSLVHKKNAKTFVLPPGWDSKEEVAKQLECSLDKVNDHLRAALNSKEVEMRAFEVWDAGLGRKVRVMAYRDSTKAQQGQTPDKPVQNPDLTFDKVAALKKAGKSWAEIGAQFGVNGERARNVFRRGR